MMSFQDQVIESVTTHAPLIVGIGMAGWWLYPKLLRSTLRNGGGEIIRSIVREENATQLTQVQSAIEEAIAKHEDVEEVRMQNALLKLKVEIEGGRVNPAEE